MAILTFRSFVVPGERGENESNNPAAFFTFSNILIRDVCKKHETFVGGQRASLVILWGQVMTLRGQILVSRTGDVTLCVLLVLVLVLVLVCRARPLLPVHTS